MKMKLNDRESYQLKKWISNKIQLYGIKQNTNDNTTLTEYTLAIVNNNFNKHRLARYLAKELRPFLGKNSQKFSDEVTQSLMNEEYKSKTQINVGSHKVSKPPSTFPKERKIEPYPQSEKIRQNTTIQPLGTSKSILLANAQPNKLSHVDIAEELIKKKEIMMRLYLRIITQLEWKMEDTGKDETISKQIEVFRAKAIIYGYTPRRISEEKLKLKKSQKRGL
ncbi:hypothetical protein DASC09_018250 [Saccharomycopsis crataegensis]|uniref:U1 small nuclear ribonucleoprotein component SNU71 n=1 Tax=Saccharomycopsis crataegensis TaxID=43959 RepID=A0AAV5QJ40_9ASCO|nr:hypothetical protein DASC09_018250 [Saccharomycopsis crataegensis]